MLAGSENAPFACYEEIHSQADRFGNCGRKRGEYKFCELRYAMQILKILFLCSYKILFSVFSIYVIHSSGFNYHT